MLAIPHEQCWTRATPAVDLCDFLFPIGEYLNFILQNSSRPEQPDDIGFFRLAKADGKFRRVLAQIP